MVCERCKNTDERYFYKGSNGYYCRKCAKFKRVLINEEIEPLDYEIGDDSFNYVFKYPLTKYQKEASDRCKELIKSKDALLHAVCGAGKTEIVVESISECLSRKQKVCYAISRREVVKELEVRFRNIFENANVVGVYGGHNQEVVGDLIVCTVHQLFRYYQTFDLLILDEVDAFPLKNNYTLMNIALSSCRGHVIFSTATINDFLMNVLKDRDYEEVYLGVRPSLKPIIEPKVIYGPLWINQIKMVLILLRMKEQCIIFLPTKSECKRYWLTFRNILNCTYVYSDHLNRDMNIKAFKEKKYKFIFATAVLERGVTILGVNCIVFESKVGVFDKSSMIQMVGRVGRDFNNPTGEAYIFSVKMNEEVEGCKEEIERANSVYEMSVL